MKLRKPAGRNTCVFYHQKTSHPSGTHHVFDRSGAQAAGYKLDSKLGDSKARFRQNRRPANTGANTWCPTPGVMDSLRRRKFGLLVSKPSTQGALARRSRPPC
ncbi:hypothetical protein ISCGN_002047 [Ixodes scapularis]